MINCFQFCFNSDVKFNLRRYTLVSTTRHSQLYKVGLHKLLGKQSNNI